MDESPDNILRSLTRRHFLRSSLHGIGGVALASLFARDPKAYDAAAARLTAARDELLKSEELWLELEMKREALEG